MEEKNYVWYKRLLTSFLIFSLCISFGVGAIQTNAAGKIKLNKTKVSLKVGKTVKLKVYGTKKKVRWISKKKSVATVSATGKVRAKKAGAAKIVAKVSGKKYTCKVTVVQKKKPVSMSEPTLTPEPEPSQKIYAFRSDALLEEHYQKHGVEMGFATKEDYVAAANVVIYSPDALHKLEAEDGDDVYYLEATNEFVIVSTDGYIRTYFYPNDGKDYFDRQ